MYWSLSLLISMGFTAFQCYIAICKIIPHENLPLIYITMKVRPLSWTHAGVFSLVTTLDYWLGLGTRLRSFQLPQTLLRHSPFWLATLSRHPQATHFSLSPPSPASREDHCLATSTIRGQPPLSNTWKRLSSAVENEHAYTSSSWYPNELEEFRYWFDSAGLIS